VGEQPGRMRVDVHPHLQRRIRLQDEPEEQDAELAHLLARERGDEPDRAPGQGEGEIGIGDRPGEQPRPIPSIRKWASPSASSTFTRASRERGRVAFLATGASSRKLFKTS